MSFRILQSFHFSSLSDFLQSLAPTAKYSIGTPDYSLAFASISVSALVAFVDKYFGMDAIAMLVLLLSMLMELYTGIRASMVRGESFQSTKLSRFTLKAGVYLFLLFATYNMAQSTLHRGKTIQSEVYDWTNNFFTVQITFEYIISILENVGSISGKQKDYWIVKLKDKISNLF